MIKSITMYIMFEGTVSAGTVFGQWLNVKTSIQDRDTEKKTYI